MLIFFAFFSQTYGQGTSGVSLSALITSSNVIFVPFLAWLFEKRKPSKIIFLFAFITMIGLMVLNWSQGELKISFGALLIFVCAVLFATQIAYLGAFCKDDNVIQLTFYQLLTSAIFSLISFLLFSKPITMQQISLGIWPTVYLAVFSTCLCYYLQTYAQQHIKSEYAGIILSMEGVFGAFFAVILAYESVRANIIGGGLIVIACVFLVNFLQLKKQKNK